MSATIKLPLYQLAHSRAGDKGNTSNISVIAWDAECYALLVEQLTEARVAHWFGHRYWFQMPIPCHPT